MPNSPSPYSSLLPASANASGRSRTTCPNRCFLLLGKPLIEIILERSPLSAPAPSAINLHYKPEMLRDWAERSPYTDRIQFFPETPFRAPAERSRTLLAAAQGPFLVHNADILLDIDLTRLIEPI